MGVKSVGGSSIDQVTSPHRAGNAKDFSKVLAEKTTSTNQKTTSLSETDVKRDMTALLRGGGDSRELVATALRNHPLVRGLPDKTREDLIAQVSSTLNPLLKDEA